MKNKQPNNKTTHAPHPVNQPNKTRIAVSVTFPYLCSWKIEHFIEKIHLEPG